MELFEELVVGDSRVILDGEVLDSGIGKHEIWIPSKEMKIVWSFNGKIESFFEWELGRNAGAIKNFSFNDRLGWEQKTLDSICDEYQIFEFLSERDISPPVKGFFHIKNVSSSLFRGTVHNDPMGVYGFFMKNASKLSSGSFNKDKFRKELIDSGAIILSEKGWGDIWKKEDNIVNGYLVDIRRTVWDMMYLSPDYKRKYKVPSYSPSKESIESLVRTLTQFPYKERKKNYQTYLLDGEYQDGSRDTLYRFETMGLPSRMDGKSVLDIGCCMGAMCFEAYDRGARKVTGIDHERDYIRVAREVSKYNKFQINFQVGDIFSGKSLSDYINSYYQEPIDVVFALSLYKHVKESMFSLLKNIKWKTCYIESNNAAKLRGTPHVREMESFMYGEPSWTISYLGETNDRSPRCLWRLDRK